MTPGATFTLSGSYTGFASPPALTYTIDGGVPKPVATVSGGTFSTTVTAPMSLGQHSVVVSSSSTASPVSLFTVALATRSISFSIPANLTPGQAFTFTGTLFGYTIIPGLTYAVDGGVPVAINGVSLTGWSMQITAPASTGSHTITVTDGSVLSTPVVFTVVATARQIAPAQPSGVLTSTAFTFTGFLAGYTSIPALTYSLDGGAPVTMTGVSVTGWAMSVTIATVGSHTLVVSDTFGTTPGSTTFTVATSTPVAVTWNPSDKASNITLSNANKTATATGSATPGAQPQAVRATIPINVTNKPVVWEVTLGGLTQNYAVGVADGTYNLLGGELGTDAVSIGAYPSTGSGSQPAQSVFYNNLQLTAGNGVSSTNGDIASFAVNGKSFFFSTPSMRTTAGVQWNNSTTADPVANTGGFPFASIAFPYYPAFSERESPGSAILNDGTVAFSTFLANYQTAHAGATVSLGAQASTPPTKTISPTQPSGVIAGAPFTFAGTINGYATAPNLTYSINGAAAVILPSVTAIGWSTTLTVASVSTYTIVVTDGSGTSGSATFSVPPSQESADRTDITSVGPIINASPTPGSVGSGNFIAITSGGQVSVNGVVIAATNGVTELYYANHRAYQFNGSAWFAPIIAGDGGASALNPKVESIDGTDITTVGPTLNASPTPGSVGSGNLIAITSGGQVSVNGTVIVSTSGVNELYYTGHTAYQFNGTGWFGPIISGNGGVGVSNPKSVTTAPQQAVAQGFTTPVINADMSSSSQVSGDVSGATVAPLYGWNQFGNSGTTNGGLLPSGWNFSNGELVITQGTSFGQGIATCCSTSAPLSTPGAIATNTGRGLAFRYGYFEGVLGWDFTSDGNRTFWMNYLNNTSTNFLELDISESFSNGQFIVPASALHKWGGSDGINNGPDVPFGGPLSALNINSTPGSISYNKIGALWTPAFIQIFFNDQPGPKVDCNTVFNFWAFGQNGPPFDGSGTVNSYMGASTAILYLQMGIWANTAPLHIKSVRVWQ